MRYPSNTADRNYEFFENNYNVCHEQMSKASISRFVCLFNPSSATTVT